jgi:hypothetical protein
MFGGDEHNPAQGGTDGSPAEPAEVDRTALFDVASRSVTRTSSPTTDVFCAGHAFLGDGRLLIAGGTESWGGEDAGGPGGGHVHQHGNFGGHQACWVYNHHRNTWQRAADLNFDLDDHGGGGRWYPSVLTLPAGDLVAFGGHPSRRSQQWHENDVPERYSPAANRWSWYPNPIHFEHPSLPGNWYPRISLTREGWVFITTKHNNQCRFFNPSTGNLVGPAIAPPPSPYNAGWDYSVILLPLVPGDGFRARVLAVNGAQPMKIDLNLDAGAPTPAWTNAGARQGSAAGKQRRFSCPVYLPTGQILVSGGINDSVDTAAVKEPEIYTPDINWSARSYGANQGSWQTVNEPAAVARNYHSVALLLPDGSVFTASSSKNADSGDPNVVGQKNIEIYFPSYFNNAGRPNLTGAPTSLNYADSRFTLRVETQQQAAAIRKVALVRCGSVTHAADFDQRYVVLQFDHQAGTRNLNVEFPADPAILPPGNYLVWVVDQNDLPCQQARFVRIAHQRCSVVTDRSTFSREEVEATGGGGTATFANALYLNYDGFIHTELTGTPSFALTWADTGAAVPASDLTLVPRPRLQEVTPGFADTPQRITFPFHVRFPNMNAFGGFPDRRDVRVTFTLGALTCTETLSLTHTPNPYMIDVNAAENNPAWLSTDVRVFAIQAGQSKFGDIFQGNDDPIPFLRRCLDRLNAPGPGGDALFDGLSTSASLDLATNGPFPMMRPIFNYAIARVRYRAKSTVAQNVKCFFRMFNVAATGLEFNPATTYRRTTVGAGTVPLVGTVGGQTTSIPFFASDRVETVQGRPGATSMSSQVLDATYERHDIAPNPNGDEVTMYFGCWLDINQTRARIPIDPGGTDGPWPQPACRSIQELVRSRHMCLVSEVFFEPDPTDPGDTPGSSDNLSQRNLAILHSDNPGGPDSHTVMHTIEIKPSARLITPGAQRDKEKVSQRFRPDELLFQWHNLPRDSEVEVYFSDIDTADIAALASYRNSPLACEFVNNHTLGLTVAGATWVPIPGGRVVNIPALLSIKLPDTVTYGQEFRVTVHQVNGRTRAIIGTCEFRIPVSKAELILDEERRTLSVFKHIATTIPSDDRWYPLIQRYVHNLGLKVDALGGDSSAVHPNPNGSGRPDHPTTDHEHPDELAGLVEEILYDCDGGFIGFVLTADCERHAFRHCETSVERLVLRACRERLRLKVIGDRDRIHRISILCCGAPDHNHDD